MNNNNLKFAIIFGAILFGSTSYALTNNVFAAAGDKLTSVNTTDAQCTITNENVHYGSFGDVHWHAGSDSPAGTYTVKVEEVNGDGTNWQANQYADPASTDLALKCPQIPQPPAGYISDATEYKIIVTPVSFSSPSKSDNFKADILQGFITVIKNVVNNDEGTKQVSDFPLFINGNPATSGTQYVFVPGTYPISETQQTGYHLNGIDCGIEGSSTTLPYDVSLANGENIVCTITNDDNPTKGSIKVTKNVVNNDNDPNANKGANDFALSVEGTSVNSGQVLTNLVPGTYTINEVNNYLQANGVTLVYNMTGISCNGNNGSSSNLPYDVTLEAGEAIECTITNDDNPHVAIPGTITVIKEVIVDHGGNEKPDDFGLSVDSSTVLSGNTGMFAVGNHTINENQLTGYELQGIVCDGNNGSSDTLPYVVNVEEGEDIVCTITNDDLDPYITLYKQVNNNFGGNAGENDFGLATDGNSVLSGDKVVVDANTDIALNEAGLTGYKFVSITGDAKCPSQLGVPIKLDEGDDITCTIVNEDIPASITLVKTVINDNGGTATANDFGLSIDGANATSGQAYQVFSNTAHVINETGLAGYSFVSITGDAKCPTELGGEIAPLDEGESITCYITNDDQPAQVTLIKNVINDNGGTKTENDFGLSIGGNSVQSGQTKNVTKNTPVIINEAGDSGYNFVSITGDGCPSVLGGTVTSQPGQNIVCTITNDDKAPTITLTKNVINDNGGMALPGDFGLSIGGTPVSSGVPFSAVVGTPYAIDEAGLFGYDYVSLTCDGVPLARGSTVTPTSLGQSISCVITNNDRGATRSQGFWATHYTAADTYWVDGTVICGKNVSNHSIMEGGFWSSISQKTDGSKRATIDQARMQLVQQLIAAKLNHDAFETNYTFDFGAANTACTGNDASLIKTYAGQAGSFNTSGETIPNTIDKGLVSGAIANSQANKVAWNNPKAP